MWHGDRVRGGGNDRLMDQAAESFEGGDTAFPLLYPLLQRMKLLLEDQVHITAFLVALNSETYHKSASQRVPGGSPAAGAKITPWLDGVRRTLFGLLFRQFSE